MTFLIEIIAYAHKFQILGKIVEKNSVSKYKSAVLAYWFGHFLLVQAKDWPLN